MNIGQTYSTSDYKLYEETGNKNHFEEVIDKLMIDEYLSTEEKEYINSLPTNKKRRAIFIIINEKSQFVLEELLNIDKGTRTKDKLRTTIEAINKYIEVGQKEVKKYGEVFTPLSLVDDMLDTLPNDVWSNPNLKWLDPANGIGNFPIRIIKRLMVGLKKEIPNIRKRYKHIIENMLYTCDLQPRNVFTYLFLVDPLDEHTTNIYTGSFLDEGFDRHMKDVWEVDKFDIVVGNPPYKRNLHMKFLYKSNTLTDDKLLYVHPCSWIINHNSNSKIINKCRDIISHYFTKLEFINGNNIFGIKLFTPCVITYINKKTPNDGFDIINRINSKKMHFNNIIEINLYSDGNIFKSLKDKIKPHTHCNLFDNVNDGNFYVNVSRIRGNVCNESMIKDDFYTFIPKKRKVELEKSTKDGSSYGFKTKKEAYNFLNYLKSNFARYCLVLSKFNSDLAKRPSMRGVPYLDFTQEWTDEKLRKKFNITDKEWEFIDSVIPDYY